jgi:hypothetical protein
MHEWLLPSVIQCLSDIDPDGWHVMEATTNFGEAQHVANNAQEKKEKKEELGWGSSNPSYSTHYKSMVPYICRPLLAFRYEILDTRRTAEIEIMLQNRNLHNPSKTVSDETIPGANTSLGYLLKTYHDLKFWQLQPSPPPNTERGPFKNVLAPWSLTITAFRPPCRHRSAGSR